LRLWLTVFINAFVKEEMDCLDEETATQYIIESQKSKIFLQF